MLIAQSEACSKACKTSVAENACIFYDRMQPQTPKASKRSVLKGTTCRPHSPKQPKVATSHLKIHRPCDGFVYIPDYAVKLQLKTLLDDFAHQLARLDSQIHEHFTHEVWLRR